MITTGSQQFRRCYLRTIISASMAFGFFHGLVLMVVGLINQHSSNINPTGFLVLIPYVTIEAMVFLIVGYILAFFPSLAASEYFFRTGKRAAIFSALFGLVMGEIFLPLCASVAFFVFPPPDGPSYFARCAEFALPVAAAGIVGGYVFWRCARGARGDSGSIADQFS